MKGGVIEETEGEERARAAVSDNGKRDGDGRFKNMTKKITGEKAKRIIGKRRDIKKPAPESKVRIKMVVETVCRSGGGGVKRDESLGQVRQREIKK